MRVVAIDGPGGGGKSAVAREVARRLRFQHIDTGAMYRAVTWLAMQRGIPLDDHAQLGELARSAAIEFHYNSEGELHVFCGPDDVTEAIRGREVTTRVSEVADCVAVRKCLVKKQQELGLKTYSVIEGRDTGTIVFEKAEWKFFIDADLRVRATRRLNQLKSAGKVTDLEQVEKDLRERDERDRNRPSGALRVASDAIVIDSSHLSQQQVVELIVGVVQERLKHLAP